MKISKTFFRELKAETINADVSHAEIVELEIGFKGIFDSMLEKDA